MDGDRIRVLGVGTVIQYSLPGVLIGRRVNARLFTRIPEIDKHMLLGMYCVLRILGILVLVRFV